MANGDEIKKESSTSNNKELQLHRKYIFITSFILLFIKYTGGDIDELNIAGVKIELKGVETIFFFLWVILGYSILRYWQYVKICEKISFVKSEYNTLRDSLFNSRLKSIVQNKYINEDKNWSVPKNERSVKVFNENGIFYSHLDKKGYLTKIWNGKVELIPTMTVLQFQEQDVIINDFKDLFFQHIVAKFIYYVNRPYIFEVYFPFVFASIVVCYFLYANYN